MTDDQSEKSDKECIDLLKYIFNDAAKVYRDLAPKGLKKSDLVLFLHPTPEQQFEETTRMTENINRLSKKPKKAEKQIKISDFEQDDLSEIAEYDEFLNILGLSVYDIFSNNHEVIGNDNKVYDLGSMRGSGRFIADFFHSNFPDHARKYIYLDFYMGSIWIKGRGDLTPFYSYIFQKLKNFNCDWKFFFPRMFLVDLKKMEDSANDDDLKNYNPTKAVEQEIELAEKDKETNDLRENLDKIYDEEYEEAKYKPLIPIVQAYKNVYGHLPNGHPQKEFE